MSKNKSTKFAEIANFSNVFQDIGKSSPQLQGIDGEVDYKGKWHTYFQNENPLVLELACGHGDYARNLAQLYPQKNYIGVDIKGNRIWSGATRAQKAELAQVAFIRTQIEHLPSFFAPQEVSEIWITFPDPQPKRARKRLTHPKFLAKYRQILAKNGVVHLKTDSELLYNFTMEVTENEPNIEVLQAHNDIYQLATLPDTLTIQTKYEKQHLANGLHIKYIQMRLV
ncbi:MAG: tRNA (guanosine(46)-N7)-methyltransferase TrmB [Chitinophagales bacterium]|nr:tRNA (guanosine(46)-N7)-methyltransferase TrmB [Bacteroidota bacterium]MCB9043798.1 tRNA (guanosine(46)-N7)-methyltransferase TrmB [Chitinophagales bacterium]